MTNFVTDRFQQISTSNEPQVPQNMEDQNVLVTSSSTYGVLPTYQVSLNSVQ